MNFKSLRPVWGWTGAASLQITKRMSGEEWVFEAPFERSKREDCHLHPSKYKKEVGKTLYPRLVDASLALVVEEKMPYVCVDRLSAIIGSKYFQEICSIHRELQNDPKTEKSVPNFFLEWTERMAHYACFLIVNAFLEHEIPKEYRLCIVGFIGPARKLPKLLKQLEA